MDVHTPVTDLLVDQTKAINGQKPELFKIKQYSEYHLILVIIIDTILLNLITYGFMWLGFKAPPPQAVPVQSLISFFVVVNVVWIFLMPFTNIYQIFGGVKLMLKIKDLFWGNLIFFGLISLIYNEVFYSIFEIRFLALSFISFTAASSITHLAMRYYNRARTSFLSYAVVGGTSASYKYLKQVFETIYGDNTHCVGRFAKRDIKGVRSLGDYSRIESFIKHNEINKLLYLNSDLTKKELQHVVQLCRNRFIEFEVVPKEIDLFQKGIQVEQLSHLPIFHRKKEPLCQLKNKILKRTFDIVFSLLVIVFLFPLLLPIIALLIKLESKGPVFFIQKRTGYWNKPFWCMKFRTMAVNENSDKKQATKNDARITKVGAFLRKTNLDEFPQFINVLKGEMSVVGPRPHMLKHTEDYSKLIDQFMIRHEVKPGITGWAQVSGWRGPTEKVYQMAKRVEFDVNYIENWSFWFDCKCIFLTVFNMFKGEENAF